MYDWAVCQNSDLLNAPYVDTFPSFTFAYGACQDAFAWNMQHFHVFLASVYFQYLL